MSLTILIPVRNEEKIIEDTLKYFDDPWLLNIDFELIIINDFCTDKTIDKIYNFNKKNYDIKVKIGRAHV